MTPRLVEMNTYPQYLTIMSAPPSEGPDDLATRLERGVGDFTSTGKAGSGGVVAERDLNRPRSLPGEIGHTLGGWFVAQVKIVVILTGIYAIGFAISGVPWWFAVAVVCGFLNFIPVAGAVIALLIVLPITWFATQDIRPVAGALATYVVAQGFEGFYLTPKIMGRRLGLSAWAVFLAILFGGFLFGPLGVLFAVPVVAVLAILWRRGRRANV